MAARGRSTTSAPAGRSKSPQLKSGEVIRGSDHRYTITNEVGHGGMGRIYKAARDDGQVVAVKLLTSDRFEIGETERSRFLRESQIARSFDHPNLVRSLDAFARGDDLVSVMEYVAGPTLEHRLLQGRSGVPDGLGWMSHLALGLSHLHDAGIIHRDISAKNALFRENGVLALCDFGVARRITDETVTNGPAVLGSLIYISMQQRQNAHDATFQDDVFSLGQVFFYIAAGINPHNAGPLAHHQNDHAAEIRALIENMRHPTREGRPLDGTSVFLRIDGFQRRLAAGVVVNLGDISFRWGLGPTIYVNQGRAPSVSNSTVYVLNPLDDEITVDSVRLEYVENNQTIHHHEVTIDHRCGPRRTSDINIPELTISDEIASRLRGATYEWSELHLRGTAFCSWAGGRFKRPLDLVCRAAIYRYTREQAPGVQPGKKKGQRRGRGGQQ